MSYCRLDLVLDSELQVEEIMSKCSQLKTGSFHYVLGSLALMMERSESMQEQWKRQSKENVN